MAHFNASPEFILLEETPSTNTELKDRLKKQKLPEYSVVITNHQSAGRGQQGNSWESEKGANLTFSVLLRPTFLEPHLQFYLSKIVSLGILDVLNKYNINATVKWPNDIYAGDQKLAGILIESSITGSFMDFTIVGIGLNVNQTEFISDAPNPVSMCLLLHQQLKLETVLQQLLDAIITRYHQLQEGQFSRIDELYFAQLYRHEGYHTYRDKTGTFDAMIKQIDPIGMLTLVDRDGREREYAFKEVEFVL